MHFGVIVFVIYLMVTLLNRGLGSSGGGPGSWKQPVTQPNVVAAFWLRMVAFFVFLFAALVILSPFERTLTPARFLAVFLLGLSPGLVLAFAPAWLLWRVSVRLRRRWISRALLYFAHNQRERAGAQHFVDAYCGRPLRNSSTQPLPMSAWIIAAAVHRAEQENDRSRAERLLKGLAALPPTSRVSSTFRTVATEILCWPALKRGDWKAVALRARGGQGRGVRLFRLLVRAHREHHVNRFHLVLSWALAPDRTRTYRYLKDALAAPTVGAVERPQPKRPSPGVPPFVLHTRLLADAASGLGVRMSALARLARSWDGEFSPANEAQFHARGLEIGARNAPGVFERLRTTVLRELEAIASTSEGSLARLSGGAMAEELARRLLNRHFESIRRYATAFPHTGGVTREFRTPLEEWEDWLSFREAVERLEALAGPEALRTAWHDGVQFAAWNWPYELEKVHGLRATWMCHVMYVWVAELAGRVGDAEAERVNRNNAKITQDG